MTIAGLALGLLFAVVPAADAAHRLVRIKHVYPGAGTATEFIVLQLGASGENQFTIGTGSELVFYDEGGSSGSEPFIADPANDESQRTVLVATPDAQTDFGVVPDLLMDDSNFLEDDDGSVCFYSSFFAANIDCVGWGDAALPSGPTGFGTLEAEIPAGSMLERSIAPNCSTLFELGDDTDQSATDFAPVAITAGMYLPRNNAAAITETGCSTPTPPSGGGGGGTTTPATTAPKKCKKGRKLVRGKCRKKKRKKKKR